MTAHIQSGRGIYAVAVDASGVALTPPSPAPSRVIAPQTARELAAELVKAAEAYEAELNEGPLAEAGDMLTSDGLGAARPPWAGDELERQQAEALATGAPMPEPSADVESADRPCPHRYQQRGAFGGTTTVEGPCELIAGHDGPCRPRTPHPAR